MTFVRRRIEAVITLGKGDFGETKGDTVKLAGLRMSARVDVRGMDSMGQIQLRIFGLPLHMINKLTAIGPIATQIIGQNRLVVSAGDEGGAMATIFDGTINQAWGEFQGAPDVVFNVQGFAGLKDALKPIPPSTFKGSADVASVMQGLAKTMGLTFENNGVALQLSNPYFGGTALEQVRSCARAAGIYYVIDRGILAIWPRRGARAGDVPVMSPETGMVGYPAFTGSGVSLTSIFTPNARLGGKIKVDSQLTPANGEWVVYTVHHDLECLMPNGPWFTQMDCAKVLA
jgi:baseplate hub protein gp41